MLQYSIQEEEMQVREGLLYLQPFLHFKVTDSGYPVRFVQNGPKEFLKVEKTSVSACITYGRMSSAFRGFFLLLSHGGEEDCFTIEETCCFTDFGIMADMSRNAVMKPDSVKRLIWKLALMGYESLQLYTEDTLKVAGEEYMGYGRGAYYREEIQEMDRFARMFGIELIPCIECLAHLNQLCNYSRYGLMMDCSDILMVGEPRTYEFIEHIFQMISESYSSRKVNVGMDEAGMLGRGQYMAKHGYRPRAEIMAEHINKVREIAKKYGFSISMWSDMFYGLLFKKECTPQETAILEGIPRDVRLIYWDYGTTDYEICAGKMENHLKITDNVAFAGGTWKWWGLVPNNQHAIHTQEIAIQACREKGIKNYLLTCWGDNGAEASIFAVVPTFFAVSRMAFLRKGDGGADWYDREFYTLTGMKWEDFMKIECINRLNPDPAVQPFNNANKYFFYNDPLKGMFDSLAKPEYSRIYEEHAQTIRRVKERTGEYRYLFETLEKLGEVLALKVCLGNEIRSAYEQRDQKQLIQIAEERIVQIMQKTDELFEAFSVQWNTDNKSFGFDVQCIRFGGVKQRLMYVRKQLLALAAGEISSIDELEEPSLPFGLYINHEDANLLYYNDWKTSVTPCCI